MDKQQRRSSRSAAVFQRDGERVAKLAMGSSGRGPANAISLGLLKHDQLESLAAPVPDPRCGGGCVQREPLTQPQMQRSGMAECARRHTADGGGRREGMCELQSLDDGAAIK